MGWCGWQIPHPGITFLKCLTFLFLCYLGGIFLIRNLQPQSSWGSLGGFPLGGSCLGNQPSWLLVLWGEARVQVEARGWAEGGLGSLRVSANSLVFCIPLYATACIPLPPAISLELRIQVEQLHEKSYTCWLATLEELTQIIPEYFSLFRHCVSNLGLSKWSTTNWVISKNRNVFSHTYKSGGFESQIKLLAGLVLPENIEGDSILCPHLGFRCCQQFLWFVSL